MKNRRAFLATVASSSVGLALADPAGAQAPAAPVTSSPVAATKLASSGSAAFATRIREFDPALTQAQLDAIAKAVDANRDAAKTLDPKKKRLENSDEPVLHFAVLRADA